MKVLFAWTPFFVLWTLFVLTYTDGNLFEAAMSGVVNSGSAAVMSIGVWRLTRKYPWPDRIKSLFYLVHFLVGLGFGLVWAMSNFIVAAAVNNMQLQEYITEPYIVFWRVLMGLWIYGCVVGICYALRNQKKLREQETRALRAEALAAQATLRSLRDQLNPHFLFNALHSVSALIPEDAKRAEKAIDQIGSLLRYLLKDREDNYVSLAEEWEFTKNYLALEKLRFDSFLEIDANFEAETMSHPVPQLILQPLVENALCHGKLRENVAPFIRINAKNEDGALLLEVQDNGIGSQKSSFTNGPGHGLSILKERLSLIYGTAASLTIDTSRGQGFHVKIRLPSPGEEYRQARFPAFPEGVLA